jgi:hypothetical protein
LTISDASKEPQCDNDEDESHTHQAGNKICSQSNPLMMLEAKAGYALQKIKAAWFYKIRIFVE